MVRMYIDDGILAILHGHFQVDADKIASTSIFVKCTPYITEGLHEFCGVQIRGSGMSSMVYRFGGLTSVDDVMWWTPR